MKINADFGKKVVVHTADMEWVESPMAGVSRRPLDRIGREIARATTIVRYNPGSRFSSHVHTGGEEFIVLDGVFQDEHGDFPVGSYIRNPPESSHTPRSELGCVIFVKLWQFDSDDRTHVRLNPNFMKPIPLEGRVGVAEISLYKDALEEVFIQHWEPNVEIEIKAHSGLEALVIEGSFTLEGEELKKQSWVRLPEGAAFKAISCSLGAKVWFKINHLSSAASQVALIESITR